MKVHKRIGAIVVLSLITIIMAACGKEETIIPGKKITLSDEEKRQADEMVTAVKNEYNSLMGRDEGGKGYMAFGNITVSISCPQGWKVFAESKDYLRAVHGSYPILDLQVETDEIYNKDYDDLTKKYIKKYEEFNSQNIKKTGKDLKKDYEWTLKHREYPKWQKVEWEDKKLNGQYYITAKGKIKASDKKHVDRGIYRYITIYNGKLLRFTFTAKDPKMDGSMTAIFDSIIQTVTYEKN